MLYDKYSEYPLAYLTSQQGKNLINILHTSRRIKKNCNTKKKANKNLKFDPTRMIPSGRG